MLSRTFTASAAVLLAASAIAMAQTAAPGAVMKQMETAGFRLAAEHTFLPYQYFLVFAVR